MLTSIRRLLIVLPLFLLFTTSADAQLKKKRYNRIFFGINMGGTWEQSDIRDVAHPGFGLTFGKYYHQNETNFFDFGWRLRYLHGTMTGLDYKKNTNIQNNVALNATAANPQLNYADSLGYVFNNYKMVVDEGAFEIMIGLNRLREKTRIVLYAFGGIGYSGWQTKMNQLDSLGQRYDYNSIELQNASSTLNQLEGLYDDSYESNANGNSKYKGRFVPSVGLGLGWQTRNGHYIGLEHRITFMMTDYGEGIQQAGGGLFGGNNDLYHYGGLYIRWMFGGGQPTDKYHSGTGTNYPPPPPPPPGPTVVPTQTVAINPPPPPPPPPGNPKPQVTINFPATSPYNTNQKTITVTANVLYVGSRNDITVKVNGYPTPNFAYDAVTKVLTVTSQLNAGNNSFYISAVNPYGNDWKSVNVIQQEGGGHTTNKPLVTITNPQTDPYNSPTPGVTVTAIAKNVNSKNDISILLNNAAFTNFTFEPNTQTISMPVNLSPGNNTVKITASNPSGSDSKSITLIYQAKTLQAGPKPVVTITSPSANPHQTADASQLVQAQLQHVSSENDIQVTLNNQPSSAFSYDPATGKLMITTNLQTGNNVLTITGKNNNGADSKSITIVYAVKTSIQPGPQVVITQPASSPSTTGNASTTLQAQVLNVQSQQEITVKVNGQPFTAFSFNATSHVLSFNYNLAEGSNTFMISASNGQGSDSKSTVINYVKKTIAPKPTVIITAPAQNPFSTTQPSVKVKATVQNITKKEEVKITVNQSSLTDFTLSPDLRTVTFTANLNLGSNPVTVTVATPAGSDSKSINLVQTKPASLPKPMVTITSPASNPHTSASAGITVQATVMNVTGKGQIVVTGPGSTAITNFQYDPGKNQVIVPVTLVPGDNTITISATNEQGSDSKSVVIKHFVKGGTVTDPIGPTKGNVGSGSNVGQKPIVTVIKPADNPHIAFLPDVAFTVKVEHVPSANNIQVTLNGNSVSNLQYDPETKMLSFSVKMPAGANNFVKIKATNAYGSDEKTVALHAN